MKDVLNLILGTGLGFLMAISGWFVFQVWGVYNLASGIMWLVFVLIWALRYGYVTLEDK